MSDTNQNIAKHNSLFDFPNMFMEQHIVLTFLGGMVIAFFFTSPLLAFGLESEPLKQPDHHTAVPRWSYHGFQGPRFWGFLEKTHKECRIGHQQSPIDVRMPHHPDHQEKLEFSYSPTQFDPVQTEHGIQFRPSGKSQLLLNNQLYQLKQFHFHDPSEHHIDGKEYPLEMHLVHEDQAGDLLVVALLFTQGTANDALADIIQVGTSPQLSTNIHNVPNNIMVASRSVFNLQHLLPENLQHFSYHGSLTTPPCTEGVQWIILRTPLPVSALQLDTLKTLYGVNARPIQPLYEREVQDY